FRSRVPQYQLAQLAVAGKMPVATLRDLAKDPHFRGIVICEITPEGFRKSQWDDQSEYVQYYHEMYGVNDKLNVLLRCELQCRLSLMSPQLQFRRVLLELINKRSLPPPIFRTTRPDRSRLDDFSLVKDPESR